MITAYASVETILSTLKPTTLLAGHLRNALKHARARDRVRLEDLARGFTACAKVHKVEFYTSLSTIVSNLAVEVSQ